MKSALLRLREARSAFSATERSIADYLLDHPDEAIELSIHEVAACTFSSAITRGMTRIPASLSPFFTGVLVCRVAIISSWGLR